jgi:hypothetical protein
MEAVFLQVEAGVRYWEDATVNGIEDTDGSRIPFKKGDAWMPIIRLDDGEIINWPQSREADIHYKVCDAGQYWLLDEKMERIAKWRGSYVPDEYLCHGDQGYGDYIIFTVAPDGKIEGWKNPEFDSQVWEVVEREINKNEMTAEQKICNDIFKSIIELKKANEALREALERVVICEHHQPYLRDAVENAKKVLQESKTVV